MALADNKTKIQALLDGINALPDAGAGEPKLQQKTVTPATTSQSVTPDSGYDGLSKVTVNAMPTATQAIPSISVSSSGLITASATQTAGYVAAGTKTMTQQLTTLAAQTITPGTSDKTISSGRYLTGTQTIKGDANLLAENIAAGISIFGVVGTFEGGGVPEGFAKLVTGTVTFADIGAAYDPSIAHNAGFDPNFFFIIAEGTNIHTDFSGRAISYIMIKRTLGSYGAYYNCVNADSTGRINSVGNVISESDTPSKLNAQVVVPAAWFKEGKTYRWYAGVLNNIS